MTLALVALTAGCSKDDQLVKSKSICEIGNTGKVVSSVSRSSYTDGSQIKIVDNATIWYCPDCSKINALDHSEGIPGMKMMDYSYVLHGNTIVNAEGKIAYDHLKFNDKGYVVYLEDFTQPNPDKGITHTSYDVEYNSEDRMSKLTLTFRDNAGKTVYTWAYELLWEGGLLNSIAGKYNDKEETKISFKYGNQANVFRQPTLTVLPNLNLLSLNPIRSFLAAGYFGKGPDRFEISSNEPGSTVAEDKTYSVELDAEGKIHTMHAEYGEGSHVDYTFTYSEVKK